MKLTNPSDQPVRVQHWVVAPKSQKAVNTMTGQVLSALPDAMARTSQVRRLLAMGALVDADAAVVPVVEVKPEEPAVPVAEPAPEVAPEVTSGPVTEAVESFSDSEVGKSSKKWKKGK